MIVRLFFLFLPLWVWGSTFTVMNYNVENLFDLEYAGSEYPDYIPNTSMQWNQKNYHKKLSNITKVILDAKADILSLEEIESQTALNDLQKSVNNRQKLFPYSAITTQKKTVVHSAILSKYPIEKVDEIIVDPNDGIRSILVATILVNNQPLTIFVNHWKSKGGAESKRVAYGKALQEYLKKHPKIQEYIITGDLNSNYNEYQTFKKSRKHNDTKGITGINHFLKTLHHKKMVTKETLITSKQDLHYDLWLELPVKMRWSHNFYGKHGSLDHIIVPKGMFDGQGIDYVQESFQVFRPNYLISKKNVIKRWERTRKKPIHHTGKGYSDHLPILAKFHIVD